MAISTSTAAARAAVSLLALFNMFSVASADPAQTFSMQVVPAAQNNSMMLMKLSGPAGAANFPTFNVVPLTANLGLNQSQVSLGTVSIQGSMMAANETSYVTINQNEIAYLCCDAWNSSYITPNMMLNALMNSQPKAILLYSQIGSCCGLQGDTLDYETILSMTSSSDAVRLLNITELSSSQVNASISGNTTSSGTGSDSSSGGSNPAGTGGVGNSAVAMSILYSITGLITLLFLIIIATGAIRAHRYPERYGPRAGHGGRPRQSRAKGIARAVLETLPIVKFGDPEPLKPDAAVELESVHVDHAPGDTAEVTSAAVASDSSATPGKQPEQNKQGTGAEVASRETHTDASGEDSEITPAPPQDGQGITEENALGCSICTEDFTVGEDVRVLPCDHKFHPACIDPWLINVSGTCPLCRLDLRPRNEDGDGTAEGATEAGASADAQDSDLPPPLGHDHDHGREHEHGNEAQAEGENEAEASAAGTAAGGNAQRSRMSRMFDLHLLRQAPVEERIEALRRYRSELQMTPATELASGALSAEERGGEDVATGREEEQEEQEPQQRGRRTRLATRLRDRFRIRTRAQSPVRDHVEEEAARS